MRSPNGTIHTTQNTPPLSFYNTFKSSPLSLRILNSYKKDCLEECFKT